MNEKILQRIRRKKNIRKEGKMKERNIKSEYWKKKRVDMEMN